jgi:hypothetical protein
MAITLGAISSALSLTKSVVQFGLSLQGASADARATRERIESVQSTLNALRLLRSDSRLQLNSIPSWTKVCDDVIQEGAKAIFNCAKPVEGCRVDDMLHGTVTVYRRITWVMRDVETVKIYEPMLRICHTNISRELGILRTEVIRLQKEDARFEELPNYEGGFYACYHFVAVQGMLSSVYRCSCAIACAGEIRPNQRFGC